MSIRLYNTLTRQKDELVPLDPANVRMYVCGPTVYDYAHIGNARPVIVFDVLYRLLRHVYGEGHVTYVRNITDIDDKINARAAETAAKKGITVEQARVEITSLTTQQYFDDVAALGCLMPNHTPRATEYVAGMIAMIGTLIEAGHAYAAEGHVLYDVSSKPDYGKLSRRSLDEMMAGARVEVAPYKKNPMDFVLWKPSDDLTPGWESPWGRGRPGWHIECSVMGGALLGETFDIHGGGVDLMFPHHENEIAQSEGAHGGHGLANIWMHNGFLQVEGEKMSKSLGNFITINELLKDWPGEVLRLNMLRTHYRQPIDWTVQGLTESSRVLDRWYNVIQNETLDVPPAVHPEFLAALFDDLNTPLAIMHLHTLNRHAEGKALAGDFALSDLGTKSLSLLIGGAQLLGLVRHSPKEWHDQAVDLAHIDSAEIEAVIAARTAARKSKNFAESDRIRDELLAQGIVLKDGPTGTTWEVKK